MSEILILRWRAGKPADVLPCGLGDMDFPVSEEITKSLHAAVEHGIYGYSQPKDAYYNAVMNWMERNHNWKTEREWIVKTPGVVFALGAAVKAFTDPGDAILFRIRCIIRLLILSVTMTGE